MLSHEVLDCMAILSDLFPQSDLTDAELNVFSDQLAKYPCAEMIAAMRTHRLRNSFKRPRFSQILDLCRIEVQPSKPKQPPKYRTTIAQGVARGNPAWDGRPEAELILRYHRHWLTWKSKHIVTDAVERYTFDAPEVFERLPKIKCQCIADLQSAGWDIEHATQAAEWIDAEKYSFDEWCASAQEIPKFETGRVQ